MFEKYFDILAPDFLDEIKLVKYESPNDDHNKDYKYDYFSSIMPSVYRLSDNNTITEPTLNTNNNNSSITTENHTSRDYSSTASSTTSSTTSSTNSSSSSYENNLPKDKKNFVLLLYNAYFLGITKYNNTHAESMIDTKYIIDLIAQDMLESNWGNHSLGFNLGGIKAKLGEPYIEAMTTEYINGKKIRIKDKFRKFNSLEEFVDFKLKFLTKGRYKDAKVFRKDFVSSLKTAGYFTAPESLYRELFNSRKKQVLLLLNG